MANNLAQRLSSVGHTTWGMPPKMVINFHGLVLSPKENPILALKFYVMQERGKHTPTHGDIREAVSYIQEKAGIEPHSGMGFSILSDGILNVCRWHEEHNDVVVPSIYTWDGSNITWQPKKIEREGAFCSREKAVYDYENNAWLEYIASERADKDKKTYLRKTLPCGFVVGGK
jgi:hypothetical protein